MVFIMLHLCITCNQNDNRLVKSQLITFYSVYILHHNTYNYELMILFMFTKPASLVYLLPFWQFVIVQKAHQSFAVFDSLEHHYHV